MRPLSFVKFATATTGTSDIAVGAADSGFITPAEAGIANGDRVPYVIDDGTDWAYGIGVYSTTGPTLARDANEVRVVAGVKSTAKLSLSGSAKVFFELSEASAVPRPEVLSQASASSLTPDINNYSLFRFTALAANLTISAPTGTAYDGQRIIFEFRDDGTERTLTWNSVFALAGEAATTGDSTIYTRYVEFAYNSARTKWVVSNAYDELTALADLQFVGGGSTSFLGDSSGSVSLTALTGGIDTTALEGDTVIVAFGQGTGTGGDLTMALTTAGYTKLGEVFSDDSNNTNLAVFRKVMGASPDTQVQAAGISGTSGEGCAMAVHVYRGVDPTTPEDVAVTTATGINGGNPNPAAITPVTAGARICVAGFGALGSSVVYSAPGDLVDFVTDNHTTSIDAVVGLGGVDWTSGAFDPAAWTGNTGTTSDSWGAITIALRPKSLN